MSYLLGRSPPPITVVGGSRGEINVLGVWLDELMCLGAPPPPITLVGGCKAGGSESSDGSPTRPLAARLVRQRQKRKTTLRRTQIAQVLCTASAFHPHQRLILRINPGKTDFHPYWRPVLRINWRKSGVRPHQDPDLRIGEGRFAGRGRGMTGFRVGGRNDYWWGRNDYGWRCPIRSGMTVWGGA